ncbi:glutathione synthase [Malassezia caprae]|uniref:Glutathione synthase n=1 Tax=Malassezia caprae TaxID=1381934 RepID=A0AAF0E8G7_9BASI|nr:glutathione synthase [Malassezia caprae]
MPPQDTTIHAPITTVPSPFPRKLFEQAMELMPIFSKLYARVALDEEFLERVMSDSVVKVDDFQRHLYDIWCNVRRKGISQPLHLGLFRSDYLMHASCPDKLSLQQVEFNTISSSFGALCTRVSELHRYLLLEPAILFVIQPNERNTFDQRAIEYTLLKKHGISVPGVLEHFVGKKYVLKPQREGGSNNIYKEDIPPTLRDMERRDEERASRGEDVSVKEREGYILMSLIDTPKDRGAMMLRAAQDDMSQYISQTTSELGTYGTALFKKGSEPVIRSGGYLLRTKASESNEGGVAVGFSVIDTPLLI